MNQGEALGRWTGAHLETFSASLNVRGAEESPDFAEFDQCFDGTFLKCLAKLKEYQIQINENSLVSKMNSKIGSYCTVTNISIPLCLHSRLHSPSQKAETFRFLTHTPCRTDLRDWWV